MSTDKGSVSNPGVELRDLIRKEATKQSQQMDQVVLATVTEIGDGTNVDVSIDGFGAGAITATWVTPVAPEVGQRVTMVGLKDGQSWYIVGVNGGSAGVFDHGGLGGLGDDDHTQYYNSTRHAADPHTGVGETDHGLLDGLADDDHTHYWNDTRGDAKIATHTAIVAAHHTRYTDAEAAAKILADDDYVKLVGDTMSGALHINIDSDVTAVAGTGSLVVGTMVGNMMSFDGNEIQTYLAGVASGVINMQLNGGSVHLGGTLDAETVHFGGQGVYGLGAVSGTYGTVQTIGTGKGSYEGYSINGHLVFMANSATNGGIYDDNANQWLLLWSGADIDLKHNNGEMALHSDENAGTHLYYNGSVKAGTESAGLAITGTLRATSNVEAEGRIFSFGTQGVTNDYIEHVESPNYHKFVSDGDTTHYVCIHDGNSQDENEPTILFFPDIPTSGSNQFDAYFRTDTVTGAAELFRYSSSARYKQDIMDFELGERKALDFIMALQTVVYRDKWNANSGMWWNEQSIEVGLIAEQVAAVEPYPGMFTGWQPILPMEDVEITRRDGTKEISTVPIVGSEPIDFEVESVHYKLMVVPLIEVAQQHERRMVAMEARLAALEAA